MCPFFMLFLASWTHLLCPFSPFNHIRTNRVASVVVAIARVPSL